MPNPVLGTASLPQPLTSPLPLLSWLFPGSVVWSFLLGCNAHLAVTPIFFFFILPTFYTKTLLSSHLSKLTCSKPSTEGWLYFHRQMAPKPLSLTSLVSPVPEGRLCRVPIYCDKDTRDSSNPPVSLRVFSQILTLNSNSVSFPS